MFGLDGCANNWLVIADNQNDGMLPFYVHIAIH